ncbi:MAG: hypothetical protein P4L83_16960 [Nevskia sp.]|nr:hypothetical protein [Nevskia sp.]
MNANSLRGLQDFGGGAAGLGRAVAAVLAAAPLLAALPLPGLAADQSIVASLNPPPAGLSCTDAAAATSVYFQFANPPFQITQVSLYVDGQGVPQDAVSEHWPTVTLSKGLHAGRNTVDLVANGASGQHIERRLVVLVGGSADANDVTPAIVDCNDGAVAQLAPADPALANPPLAGEVAPSVVGGGEPEPVTVVDTPPPAVYDEPAAVAYPAPVYPAPVYVYTPYPVVAIDPWVPLLPFFAFGFFYSNYHPYCPPPAVVYNSYYGHGGWHGGPGGGWNGGGGGGWHGGGNPGGGWNGGGNPGSGGNPGPYPQPHPPGAVGSQGGAQPMNASANRFAGGGWHGAAPAAQPAWRGGQGFAPRPQPAPTARPTSPYHMNYGAPAAAYRPAAASQYRPAPQFRPAAQQYRSAPQFQPAAQYRPAPAPAFHGGGGGGWHPAPAPRAGGGGWGHHR